MSCNHGCAKISGTVIRFDGFVSRSARSSSLLSLEMSVFSV